jgi:hypothetical protein
MVGKIRLSALVLSASLLAASALPVLAAAPANDDIGDAIVVGAIPYTNTQDTSEATQGATDPDCYGAGPTVWYEHTATADGRLEANTFGSNYDTTLYVGTPDGQGGIDLIACNDDASGLQSRVRFDAEDGVTYLFMVGAYDGGDGGELVFNLLVAPPVQPLDVSISLDGTAKFDRAGVATLSGTVSCTGADWLEIEGELRQQVGRFTVSGWGYTEAECTSEPSPFQLSIAGQTGKFGGGQASATVWAYACGDEDCAFDSDSRTVRLRH